MMTDTVVRIEAVRYGLLQFATLVVHNTQGIAADSFNNARPCWRKGVSIMLAGLASVLCGWVFWKLQASGHVYANTWVPILIRWLLLYSVYDHGLHDDHGLHARRSSTPLTTHAYAMACIRIRKYVTWHARVRTCTGRRTCTCMHAIA